MTVVYAPSTPETNQIMNYFQTKNQARTNVALQIESQVWEDMSSVPKSDMGIVPMPSDKFIYDYALAHPDTIQLGMIQDNAAMDNSMRDDSRWQLLEQCQYSHTTIFFSFA